MTTFKNDEYYPIGNSVEVTVSVTFMADAGDQDDTHLRNAADAISFFGTNDSHKTWARRIEVK